MKIDVSEVRVQKELLVISVNSIKEQLSVSRSRLSEVVSTDSLKGAVKDAINQKVTNYQIPLVDNYVNALDSIVSRYDGLVKLFQDTVSETDNSAIIKTEYLERIKQRMKDPIEGLKSSSGKTKNIYAGISDILTLTNPSLDSVNTSYNQAVKSLDDTIKNMEAFNSVLLKTDTFDLIDMQNSEIATLSGYAPLPYGNRVSRNYYNRTQFKNSVSEIHTAIHSNSKAVKYQNALAKQLAESKYSGTVDLNKQNYSDKILNDLQNDFIGESFMNSIDVFGDKGWVALLEKTPTVLGGVLSTLYKLSDSLGNFINLGTNGLISPNVLDGISNSSSGVIRSLSEGIETFAKSGPEIGRAMAFIGPAIDFTTQVSAGENVPNAVIKTGIHTIVSGAAVKGGMAIGTAIMPGVGTVIGFLGGVAVGIIANSAIDMIYDNTVGEFVTETTDNMMKAGKEVIDGVGNAVSDFFSGIGTVFQ
mgnify:CR=1 FL=1